MHTGSNSQPIVRVSNFGDCVKFIIFFSSSSFGFFIITSPRIMSASSQYPLDDAQFKAVMDVIKQHSCYYEKVSLNNVTLTGRDLAVIKRAYVADPKTPYFRQMMSPVCVVNVYSLWINGFMPNTEKAQRSYEIKVTGKPVCKADEVTRVYDGSPCDVSRSFNAWVDSLGPLENKVAQLMSDQHLILPLPEKKELRASSVIHPKFFSEPSSFAHCVHRPTGNDLQQQRPTLFLNLPVSSKVTDHEKSTANTTKRVHAGMQPISQQMREDNVRYLKLRFFASELTPDGSRVAIPNFESKVMDPSYTVEDVKNEMKELNAVGFNEDRENEVFNFPDFYVFDDKGELQPINAQQAFHLYQGYKELVACVVYKFAVQPQRDAPSVRFLLQPSGLLVIQPVGDRWGSSVSNKLESIRLPAELLQRYPRMAAVSRVQKPCTAVAPLNDNVLHHMFGENLVPRVFSLRDSAEDDDACLRALESFEKTQKRPVAQSADPPATQQSQPDDGTYEYADKDEREAEQAAEAEAKKPADGDNGPAKEEDSVPTKEKAREEEKVESDQKENPALREIWDSDKEEEKEKKKEDDDDDEPAGNKRKRTAKNKPKLTRTNSDVDLNNSKKKQKKTANKKNDDDDLDVSQVD